MKSPTAADKSFGILVFVVALILSITSTINGNVTASVVFGIIAVASIALALTRPKVFRGMKNGWLWIGDKLRLVVSPVVLAILFFGVITPVGVISRLFGRDTLRTRSRGLATYWTERQPCGRAPETFFKQQF